MTSPLSPDEPDTPSYRTNVNRVKTKRWAEAKPQSYEGDDWGGAEDSYEGRASPPGWNGGRQPPSQFDPHQRFHYHGPTPQPLHVSNRSMTAPFPANGNGRASFDHEVDHRNVGSRYGGFQNSQVPPHNEEQFSQNSNIDPTIAGSRGQILHVQTPDSRPLADHSPYNRAPFVSDARGGPHTAPAGPPSRIEHFIGQTPNSSTAGRNENAYKMGHAPASGESRLRSQAGSYASHEDDPSTTVLTPESMANPHDTHLQSMTSDSSGFEKPLPLIRPSDIYKRVEEEREKEKRKSQESSRQSFESASARPRKNSAGMLSLRSRTSDSPEPKSAGGHSLGSAAENYTTRRTHPVLDPVAERKAEYDLHRPWRDAPSLHSEALPAGTHDRAPLSAGPTTFGDRIAVSPQLTNPLSGALPEVGRISEFSTDFINQGSEFATPLQAFPSRTESGRRLRRRPGSISLSIPHSEDLPDLPSFPDYRTPEDQTPRQPESPTAPTNSSEQISKTTYSEKSSVTSPIISSGSQQDASAQAVASPQIAIIAEDLEADRRPPPSNPVEPLTIQTKPISAAQALTPDYPRKTSTSSSITSPSRQAFGNPTSKFNQAESPTISASPTTLNELNINKKFPENHSSSEDSDNPLTPSNITGRVPSRTGSEGSFLIPTRETPTKGTVRNIATRFETQSDKVSPVRNTEQSPDLSRPSNPRLETFRPAIPGGWQSYSNSTEASTPPQEPIDSSRPELKLAISDASIGKSSIASSEEDDDIPTAGPPKSPRADWGLSKDSGPSKTAFEALAAASSGLATAFGAITGMEVGQSETNTSHDNDDSRSLTPESMTHDSADKFSHNSTTLQESSERPLSPKKDDTSATEQSPPPSPLSPSPKKETPSEADYPQSTLGYFPSPLKPSKTNESTPINRPQVLRALSSEASSSQGDDNDSLRKEIVQGLALKTVTSKMDDQPRSDDGPMPGSYNVTMPESRWRIDSSPLPKEYISYWNETAKDPDITPPDTPQDLYSQSISAIPQPSNSQSSQPEHMDTTNEASDQNMLDQRFSWEPAAEQAVTRNMQTPVSAQALAPNISEHSSENADSPHTIKIPRRHSIEAESEVSDLAPSISKEETQSRRLTNWTDVMQSLDKTPKAGTDGRDISGTQQLDPPIDEGTGEEGDSRSLEEPEPAPAHRQEVGHPTPLPPVQNALTFREIVSLKTPQERIQAFNSSRQVLAKSDNGLAHWLQSTGTRFPEHSDVLSSMGRLSTTETEALNSNRLSVLRSKFPRVITPSGSTLQSNAEPHESPKNSMHSPSSGVTTGPKQEESKKFLQSAGKLGGKAGVAAKGFFAKSKNKFRTSDGGEKGAPTNSRKSQPVVAPVQEEPQRISKTPSTAPQIPPQNLNISPVGDYDSWSLSDTTKPQATPQNISISPVGNQETWSLSYAPTNSPSRTSNNDRDLSLHPTNSVKEEKKYANLGPPEYSGPSPAAPTIQEDAPASIRVSDIGSTPGGDLPSRSISEVTHHTLSSSEQHSRVSNRPNAATSQLEEDPSSALSSPNTATTRFNENRAMSPNVLHPDSALRILSPILNDSSANINQKSTHPSHSRLSGEPSVPDFLTAGGNARHSVNSAVSAISSPSPGPPEKGVFPSSAMGDNQRSISPAMTKLNENSAHFESTEPPPHDDGTPPYSESSLSKEKEAEAEAERVNVRHTNHSHDGPPAYRMVNDGTNEQVHLRLGQQSSIVPVADLSGRRRQDHPPVQARPFSFVGSNTFISRGQENIDSVVPAAEQEQEIQDSEYFQGKGLNKSEEVSRDDPNIERDPAKSYSKAFGPGPNVENHPAFRPSQDDIPVSRVQPNDSPLPSANRPQQIANRPPQATPAAAAVPPQQYRIPGPYVQEYRSPKQTPQAFAAGQLGPDLRYGKGLPGKEKDDIKSPRSFEQQVVPRPTVTPRDSQGAAPVDRAESMRSALLSRVSLQRSRSGSRQRVGDAEELERVASVTGPEKKEKRGSFFRSQSKRDSVSIHSQLENTANTDGGSRDALASQQMPSKADGKDYAFVNNDYKSKEKEKDGRKKLAKAQRAPPPSSPQPQAEGKKKGFSRLSGLFGKSTSLPSKSTAPAHAQQPGPRSSTPQSMLSPPGNMSAVQQQTALRPVAEQQLSLAAQAFSPGHPQQYHNFQGQPPPVGGYYAPANQSASRSPIMPHDPDSVNGGRFIPGQHVTEQNGYANPAYHDSVTYSQQSPQPQQMQMVQQRALSPPPLSSPIAFAQQQRQQLPPQTQSQDPMAQQLSRSPQPPLRIDTSASGPHGGSQVQRSAPPAAMEPQRYDTAQDGRSYLATQSQNPVRQSPYDTRQGQHSPYGYGSARGLTKDTLSHAIDLHKRSRSPRNGRKNSGDFGREEPKMADPASQLGTFSKSANANANAQRSGDGDTRQETPWKIGLPSEQQESEEQRRDRLAAENAEKKPFRSDDETARKEQVESVAERVIAANKAKPPLGRSASGGNAQSEQSKQVMPVELPGSKAPGDESDEEVLMSATAYPGQEWMPEMGGYGHWDD